MSHHCHTCGQMHHDDRDDQFTRQFMHSVLQALKGELEALNLIIHKLNEVLKRLPEPVAKPAHMELKFGEPNEP